MYTLQNYGSMIADRARTAAYAEAIRRTVRPGSVVLDLGTGPGVLALMACRAGARKVYAAEPSPVVHVAEQLAAANGFGDRITCIRDMSTRITLPEPVDTVVAEIHGLLPPFGASLFSLIDARRFLAPNGAMIPREETIWAAVVEDEQSYRPYTDGWDGAPYDIDLTIARTMALNSVSKMRVGPANLLSAAARVCVLDYRTLTDPNVAAAFTVVADRTGTGHGIVAWFDSVLADEVGFSNAPGRPPLIFGQMFFPWPSPVALAAGDRIAIELHAKFIENDYVWAWSSSIAAAGGEVKASFRQSTFHSTPISLAQLARESPDYVPDLSAANRIARFVLDCIDGRTPVAAIAARVAEQFPDRFASSHDALAHVRSVVNAE